MRVAVIGAGVTGLTAAYLCLQRGVEVSVFDAAPREGGLAGTFRSGQHRFDFGPHELSTRNPILRQLLAEICGRDLITVEKRVAQHIQGKYVRYPFEIADVICNLEPRLWLRACWDVLQSRFLARGDCTSGENFATWTKAHFGQTLLDQYFGPYTSKVWGCAPNELDVSVAQNRIAVTSAWDLLYKTLRFHFLGKEDLATAHSEIRHSFLYTKRGIGTLLEHLARRVAELGGDLQFGKRLHSCGSSAAGVADLRFCDGTRTKTFDRVVSTIPLTSLVRALFGNAAQHILQENPLRSRAMCFVFLRLRKTRALDYHWAYYPGAEQLFQRVTEFSHFGADMSPAGESGLTLEISCNKEDETWKSSDRDLGERCVHALMHLGHLRGADVIDWDVVRVGEAYPMQTCGFREHLGAILDALARVPNVVTLGRQGLHRYCNMDECMEMALDVVPRMLSGEHHIRYRGLERWRGVGTGS